MRSSATRAFPLEGEAPGCDLRPRCQARPTHRVSRRARRLRAPSAFRSFEGPQGERPKPRRLREIQWPRGNAHAKRSKREVARSAFTRLCSRDVLQTLAKLHERALLELT